MAHYVYAWPGTHIDKHLFEKWPGDWTLPGHNYIRPGNPLPQGFPVDRDDLIALRHDYESKYAKNDEDIRNANRTAINDFWEDATSNYNLQSLVGAAGIGLKYAAETVLGVQYPKVDEQQSPATSKLATKHKLTNTVTGEETPTRPSKESKMPTGQSEGKAAGQAGTSAVSVSANDKLIGGGGTDSSGVTLERPIPNSFLGTVVFRHKRIMTSYGINFHYVLNVNAPATDHKDCYLITTLACVSADTVSWYLSPVEFQSLPITSEVIQCKTVCTSYGYRLPFLVKGSGLQYANAQADIIGCYAIGLNNKYNGSNFKLTYDTTDM